MAAKKLAPEFEARIEQLWSRFPEENVRQSLCIPVLYMAQQQYGHIDQEVIDMVAERLELPPSHVLGVATFYTMFNTEPVGRFHLQVCTNIGCMLEGGYEVFDHCKRRLKVQNHGTTEDDAITLSEVECLAACGYGPVAQIAERGKPDIPLYFENLDIELIDKIIDALKQGKVPTELGI